MLTSSRDNWERLVAAVVKRQQIWELCHQQSRSPSICSTNTSDDLSQQISSFSGSDFEPFTVSPSPLLPLKNSSFSPVLKTTRGINNAFSRSITRILFSAWYRRKSKDQDLVDIQEYPEVYLGQLERFSLRQLQVATDNFSDKNILKRPYRSEKKVYKGRLVDGTLVAIKRTTGGEHGFQTEVEVFSIMPEHRNHLRLRGICITSEERLLVYPYMVNGSVASCLRERSPNIQPPLDWQTRKRIAMGCARGLSYLHDHCEQMIVHCKVKASNILLDKDYEAVVGDFSSAKLIDHNDTRGLFSEKLLEKSDVHGYGFTLLELITGQKPFDFPRVAHDDNLMLLDWVKGLLKDKKLETLVDCDLKNNYVEGEVQQLIQVALLCTQNSALGRPKMSEVVKLLEGDGLAEKLDEWHKVNMK